MFEGVEPMKLDLRKTRASTVIDNFDEDFFLDERKGSSLFSKVEIDAKGIIGFLLRLVLCAVGTVVLMYLEKQNLDKLNGEKALVNNEFSELKGKKTRMEKEIKGFEYMASKSKEFNNKLNIMQRIVDRRLLAVTGLDHIQTVIPEEVWLKEVRFDKKHFTITGVSTTNKQIQNFVEELERTKLFSKVNLERAAEETTNKTQNRRSFVIVSTLK